MNTRQIQEHLVMDEADIELKMMQERNADIRKLEEGVIDNHSLMLQVSLMVQEQGDMIDCIEANMDRAINNTEKGVTSLEKAEEHHRCTIL